MAGQIDSGELAARLRLRLNEMIAQKEASLKQISEINEELQRLYAKAPRRNRETAKELEDHIVELEFKRTTTSLSLQEEKMLLRQIDSCKRAKTQVEERQAHEHLIQEKKAQISELRDSLSMTLAAIDELSPVLAKVELAKKLSCSAEEIKTITVEYPPEKTRHIIGKNGSTIKQIQDRCNVSMDVDSDKAQIVITGNEASLELATKEINKITHATEEAVAVSPALVTYLTTHRLNAFAEIRAQHPHVYFDVPRNGKTVHLEGLPEDIEAAKSALASLDVKQESRSLTSIEAGVVVGKKGVNINQLVDQHHVAIEVENNDLSYTVAITGPSAKVDAALASVDELLESNKDITESVDIDAIVRNALLNAGGVRIKQLQKDINDKTKEENLGTVFLSIDKDCPIEESSLLVKGRRPAVAIALGAVDAAIEDIMNSIIVIQVDPYVVPRLIGKGGSNIKEMKKTGHGVIIEVHKSGKVQLFAADPADLEAVQEMVRKVIAENQVKRIDLDYEPNTLKLMFRALIRSKGKELNAIVSGLDLDEETSQIVLRGSEENIQTTTDVITEFMANNYIAEVGFAPEDEHSLLVGGSDCVVNKLGKEFGVEIGVVRSNHLVAIRGKKDDVDAATKRLNQFLNGGDGYSVSKVLVSEQAVGVVIGKGGSRRAELESKYEGVKIVIERNDGVITLRGPDETVQACRTDIIRIVSSVRVTESMPITSNQHADLSKPDVIRRVTAGIPAQVTLTESEVKIRGIYADAKDALAMLKAHLTGVYEALFPLEPELYTKVKVASRDAAHFNQITNSTQTEIKLEPSSNAIILSGKRANVKKAKILLMGFLDFLLPSCFEHMKIPKVFHSAVANAASLADVAAHSGASVALDRDLNSVHIQSPDPEKVKEASNLIKAKISEAEKLMFVMPIDKDESWLIPAIIGKGGGRINALSTETGCRIDVSKQELTVTVTGENEESVANAKARLEAVIDKARRECAVVTLPHNSVSAFVGKGGAHIQQFSEQHGVEVERIRKDHSKIKITGPEDAVAAAHQAVLEWIRVWQDNHAEVSIQVEKSMIPAVIGNKGSVINAIQKDSGCRIDIDRDSSTLTVQGGSEEKRQEAIAKIQNIIAEAEALENERQAEREEKKEQEAVERRAERAKTEKPQPATPQPVEDTDARKDRTAEFAARPIGLSSTDKSKKGRNGKSKAESALVGTAAGRDLFGLLVSSSDTEAPLGVAISREDESDMSSQDAAAESGQNYYKSASGFSVRV